MQRRRRRCGCRASTTPAIAAQNAIERELAAEGLDPPRHRPRGVPRAHLGVGQQEPRSASSRQHKRLGISADWSRETLHDGRRARSAAVRTIFVDLYDDGPDLSRQAPDQLVPRLPAALSATSRSTTRTSRRSSGTSATRSSTTHGNDTGEYITIATTRPETIVGRHRRRRAPGGRALRPPASARTARLPIIGRAAPDHRRRGGRAGVRHRRAEGDARPRPDRLRDRRSATTCRSSTSMNLGRHA